MVPRHERAGMCEVQERARAETWWCIMDFILLGEMSLNPVALVRECAESNDGK